MQVDLFTITLVLATALPWSCHCLSPSIAYYKSFPTYTNQINTIQKRSRWQSSFDRRKNWDRCHLFLSIKGQDEDDYNYCDDTNENDPLILQNSNESKQPIIKSTSLSSTCNNQTTHATLVLPHTQQISIQRPDWALPWMPTSLLTLRPLSQFFIGLLLYIFHLRILTQHMIAFPFQLIPNEHGWFTSIGWDSLAGMAAAGTLFWLRRTSVCHVKKESKRKMTRTTKNNEKIHDTPHPLMKPSVSASVVAIPPIWSDPTEEESPWKLRSVHSQEQLSHPRSTSILAFFLLTIAYFSTGRVSLLFENGLYAAAGYGLPLTVPMHRSLVVLLGHLTWVAVGSAILAGVLSPKPFFGGGWRKEKIETTPNKKRTIKKTLRPFRWYTNKWDTYWLWWTIGGYFVSAWLFNIADWINQIVLPPHLFAQQAEGVVSQLINPENNDFLASLVGYIAPCLSAPWWEEVLYRGYLLPALRLFMGFWPSVFVSGVLFSAHHLSVMGAIPLAVLGWLWAALYAKSGNILVTILIHGMWNSRVFLGSWLGL